MDKDEQLLNIMERMSRFMEMSADKEQREKRWFRVKVLLLICAITLPVAIYATGLAHIVNSAAQEHVAVVRVDGAIGGSNAYATARQLDSIRKAMVNPNSKGLILQIDSPGGSPSQAEIIYKTLVDLRSAHPDKPIIAVGEDAMTSAAYLIAVGADKIYAQESTLVGSIGVIFQNFNFTDLMDRLGVKANTRTSGKYKDVGSSFRDWTETDNEVVGELISDMEATFIGYVEQGRGDRLVPREDLFSGRFWTGKRAAEIGLVDGIRTPVQVVAEEFPGLKERVYGQPNAIELLKSFNSKLNALLEIPTFQ